MIAVWYLIVSYYHGGTVAIPQSSVEQCMSNATWLSKTLRYNQTLTNRPSAYCIPGVK